MGAGRRMRLAKVCLGDEIGQESQDDINLRDKDRG